MTLDISNPEVVQTCRDLVAKRVTAQGALERLQVDALSLKGFLGRHDVREALQEGAGGAQSRSKAREGSGQELAAGTAPSAVAVPSKAKPGGRLRIDDASTFDALAERSLGLVDNAVILHELETDAGKLARFLKRKEVMAKLKRQVATLQQSGEVARRQANKNLSHGVQAMAEIIRDPDLGPSAKIGATSTLSKIGGTNGKQHKDQEQGPRFSITINLKGREALNVETPIEGEVIRDE